MISHNAAEIHPQNEIISQTWLATTMDNKDWHLEDIMESRMANLSQKEKRLVKAMISNRTYPFTPLSPNILEFETRYRHKLVIAAGCFIVLLAWVALHVAFHSYMEFIHETLNLNQELEIALLG